MKTKNNFANLLIGVCILSALSACMPFEPTTDNTVFHLMKPANNIAKVGIDKSIDVNLMPVSLPQYFTRNQIVVNSEGSKVMLSNNDRWAESTGGGFTRVLAQNISGASENIDVLTYPSQSRAANSLDLRVEVWNIDGNFNGDVKLSGRWQLVARSGKKISKQFEFKVPCGDTYGSYVEAINAAIYKLSDEIVKNLEPLIDGK